MQAQKEYLITRRSGTWSVICGDEKHGPYLSRQVAIDSALTMAKSDFRAMITAMVWLEDEGKMEPIYDSAIPNTIRR